IPGAVWVDLSSSAETGHPLVQLPPPAEIDAVVVPDLRTVRPQPQGQTIVPLRFTPLLPFEQHVAQHERQPEVVRVVGQPPPPHPPHPPPHPPPAPQPLGQPARRGRGPLGSRPRPPFRPLQTPPRAPAPKSAPPVVLDRPISHHPHPLRSRSVPFPPPGHPP